MWANKDFLNNKFTHKLVAVTMAFVMAVGMMPAPVSAAGETVVQYDSKDRAIVVKADRDSVTLRNIGKGRNYTLKITGTSRLTGAYGSPMTGEQLERGEIADVTFMRELKTLSTLTMCKDAFAYKEVTDFNLGEAKGTARIGGATLEMPSDTPVLTEDGTTDIYSVGKWDTISVYGVGHTIECISVDRGHGFISLRNDKDVRGGWIEVGNTLITKVTEGMVLTVPEGEYKVTFDSSKMLATKKVTVERDRETVIDLEQAEVEILRQCKVTIAVLPEEAEPKLFVDGEEHMTDSEFTLDYGVHRVDMEASGYTPLTKYINLGSQTANFRFTLEKAAAEEEEEEETEEETESSEPEETKKPETTTPPITGTVNSLSGNVLSGSSSLSSGKLTSNTVYIKAPAGTTLTLDGKELGVVPISFPKVVGTHVLTFSKASAVTHGYTVYFYDDGEDVTYNFPDL
ncbi:MAG: hypothetical protein K6E33_03140 [Lachnospiraceae bacterium]|nr:hypothetical protein [Lachnospiraceae bacterium]